MQPDTDNLFEQAAGAGEPTMLDEPTMAGEPTLLDEPTMLAGAAPDPRASGQGFFPQFGEKGANPGTANDLDMILDIPVTLTVELGRTRIPIKTILQLAQGSVIELDSMAGEPMDVLVNGFLIAQGEVVVVNDKFGIRLTDVVTPSERLRRLNR